MPVFSRCSRSPGFWPNSSSAVNQANGTPALRAASIIWTTCCGLVLNVVSAGLCAAVRVGQPGLFGQVQAPVDERPIVFGRDVAQERGDLAVVDPTQCSRVLPLHPDRFGALLREPGRIG